MAGEVHKVLREYYTRVGIIDDNLVNRLKQRNIRIQLCLSSVDLSRFSETSIDDPADVAHIKRVLSDLPVGSKENRNAQ